MPVVPFLAGVTYDSLTLTRIDHIRDNLILLLYVSLLGALIVLTGRTQMAPFRIISPPTTVFEKITRTLQPYLPLVLQFLFGSLFSAYAVVYFQSVSLDTTAVFLIIILLLLIINEFLRKRFSSLSLLITLYAFVTFSFFTFFLPVLTGWMNTWVFLVGAILSAGVIVRVVQLTYKNLPLTNRWTPVFSSIPALSIIGLFVWFYFLNWIPPVPLSLKFGGVYHEITKTNDTYHLTFAEGSWYQWGKRSDDTFQGTGPLYCFTAVFAPLSLETTIFHHWQHRPLPSTSHSQSGRFSTTDRIPITISGGREHGYRSYTVKQRVPPGDWRVDVETKDGRLIGRITFTVTHQSNENSTMKTIPY